MDSWIVLRGYSTRRCLGVSQPVWCSCFFFNRHYFLFSCCLLWCHILAPRSLEQAFFSSVPTGFKIQSLPELWKDNSIHFTILRSSGLEARFIPSRVIGVNLSLFALVFHFFQPCWKESSLSSALSCVYIRKFPAGRLDVEAKILCGHLHQPFDCPAGKVTVGNLMKKSQADTAILPSS